MDFNQHIHNNYKKHHLSNTEKLEMLQENQLFDDLKMLYGREEDEPYRIGFWSFDGLSNTDSIVKISLILASTLIIISLIVFLIYYLYPYCFPREFDEEYEAAFIEFRNKRQSINEERELDEQSPISDSGSEIIEAEEEARTRRSLVEF